MLITRRIQISTCFASNDNTVIAIDACHLVLGTSLAAMSASGNYPTAHAGDASSFSSPVIVFGGDPPAASELTTPSTMTLTRQAQQRLMEEDAARVGEIALNDLPDVPPLPLTCHRKKRRLDTTTKSVWKILELMTQMWNRKRNLELHPMKHLLKGLHMMMKSTVRSVWKRHGQIASSLIRENLNWNGKMQ